MKTILLSGAISMIIALMGTRPTIPCCASASWASRSGPTGTRPTWARAARPPWGHHHHHRVADRLRARALVHQRPDDRLRRPGAVPDDRPRLRRLPRRLHQAVHAPQPRPAQRGQAARPGGRRRHLRGTRDPLPRRLRPDPGVDAHLVPRRLRRLDRHDPVRRLGADHGHRHLQRGEPHRRPRRPGHRGVDPGARRLRDHRELAAPQRLHHGPRPELLRRQRPARRRRGRRRRHGRLLRLPVVERAARQDLHGRHRLARPRRRPGRPSRSSPGPTCCCSCSAACS